LRAALASGLRDLAPWTVFEGCLNSVLCLGAPAMPAPEIADACRRRGVYVRDCSDLSPALSGRALRIAVRDAPDNARILRAVAESL
jgi:histidinol-phosphate/aromatic aminotransferase/cobyric acid decarboxylase-like protein